MLGLIGPLRRIALVAVAAGCSADDGDATYRDPAAVEARLRATLEEHSALGDKRAGSPGGMQAGELVHDRFLAAGLEEVGFESFEFPAFSVAASDLRVETDGGAPRATSSTIPVPALPTPR